MQFETDRDGNRCSADNLGLVVHLLIRDVGTAQFIRSVIRHRSSSICIHGDGDGIPSETSKVHMWTILDSFLCSSSWGALIHGRFPLQVMKSMETGIARDPHGDILWLQAGYTVSE